MAGYEGEYELLDSPVPDCDPKEIRERTRSDPSSAHVHIRPNDASFSCDGSNAERKLADKQMFRVLLLRSFRLVSISQRCSFLGDRSLLVNALIDSYFRNDGTTEDEGTTRITEEEVLPAEEGCLEAYHAEQYLAALMLEERLAERERTLFRLTDDCRPFPGLFEYCRLVAGGSLQAARAINKGRCRIAVHLDGGRHHARKSSAAGFCFVNDVVLLILELLKVHERVMYVDVDIHHGDAVEEAFFATDRVLTVSMHHHAPGFYPATVSGALGSFGSGKGLGFALNIPLAEGLRDELFVESFQKLVYGAVSLFRPNALVLQAGCDGLAGDPVGQYWMLSPLAFHGIACCVAKLDLPTVVLGGGGYMPTGAACAWTALMSGLLNPTREFSKDVDIPDHEYIDRYTPFFSLSCPGKPLLAKEKNNPDVVATAITSLLAELAEAIDRSMKDGCSRKHRRLAQ